MHFKASHLPLTFRWLFTICQRSSRVHTKRREQWACWVPRVENKKTQTHSSHTDIDTQITYEWSAFHLNARWLALEPAVSSRNTSLRRQILRFYRKSKVECRIKMLLSSCSSRAQRCRRMLFLFRRYGKFRNISHVNRKYSQRHHFVIFNHHRTHST